ncbi:MAG TPA: CvpA family protein [Acidimicrobiia bacterium]|nr:CvpA family protein [Acidimicrobiia bacterium]
MIDFILGVALAAMLVRGWTRGFVRESLDLIGLIVGAWVAFRLSAPVGDFLASSFGVGPEVARIGAGILLFVLFGVLLSIASYYLSKAMNLPGLSMVNRVGGAAVAIGWGAVVVLLVVSLLTLAPIPDSWRDHLNESRVVQAIAGPAALPRQFFEKLAGDNVMSAMSAIREIFGESRAIPQGSETLQFPPAAADEIRQVRDEAARMLDEVNEHRVGLGLGAVTEIAAITALAEDHAAGLYRAGLLRRMGDCVSNLDTRGYQVVRCDNGVALAATAAGALSGIEESAGGQEMLATADYDRAGVAVVDGPTGRLLIVILAG